MNTRRWGGTRPSLWGRTPFRLEDWFDEDAVARSRRYTRPKRRWARVESGVDKLVTLVILRSHAVPWVLHHAHVTNWVLGVVVANAVLGLVATVVATPRSWWVELSYDRAWDLSNQTPGGWAGDLVKGFAVGMALTSIFAIIVYAVIRATTFWWLWATLALMALQVVLLVLYPVVIMPVFNKFTPLSDGEARDRIDRVSELAGVSIQGSFVMDASKRSRRDNAMVAGFGRTKRVVVFDTLLEHPAHVVEQVVAHEIGHYRLRHLVTQLPAALVRTAVTLGALELILSWHRTLSFAGVKSLGDPGSLPLFFFGFAVLNDVTQLGTALLSRHHEREADLEALELLGDPGAMIDVWRRMSPKNLFDLEPSAWQRFIGSHPEIPERMEFAKRWAEMNSIEVHTPEVPEPEPGEFQPRNSG